MESVVHLRRARRSIAPGRAEGEIVRPPAFETGPVPGRQRRRLIEEEELSVGIGSHQSPPPAAELAKAGEPGPGRPATPRQRSRRPVMQAAAVAHECPALWVGDDLAEGRHTVLQRHDRNLLHPARPRSRFSASASSLALAPARPAPTIAPWTSPTFTPNWTAKAGPSCRPCSARMSATTLPASMGQSRLPQPGGHGPARLRPGRVQATSPIRCPPLVAALRDRALPAPRADREPLARGAWASPARFPADARATSSPAATRPGQTRPTPLLLRYGAGRLQLPAPGSLRRARLPAAGRDPAVRARARFRRAASSC